MGTKSIVGNLASDKSSRQEESGFLTLGARFARDGQHLLYQYRTQHLEANLTENFRKRELRISLCQ